MAAQNSTRRHPNFKDITGQIFDYLTALSIAGRNKHGNILWNCLCRCGATKIVTATLLIRGKTRSCGCLTRPPLIARFWRHVDKTGECWLWKMACDKDGYGQFSYTEDGKNIKVHAHRFIWSIKHGPIPPGILICHECDNPPCVREDHLFSGTILDNNADRNAKGRQAKGDRSGNHIHVESRPRGETHGRHKLTLEQVLQIKKLLKIGARQNALGELFHVSSRAINAIASGQNWRWVEEA